MLPVIVVGAEVTAGLMLVLVLAVKLPSPL
jgi:hypothetical protein